MAGQDQSASASLALHHPDGNPSSSTPSGCKRRAPSAPSAPACSARAGPMRSGAALPRQRRSSRSRACPPQGGSHFQDLPDTNVPQREGVLVWIRGGAAAAAAAGLLLLLFAWLASPLPSWQHAPRPPSGSSEGWARLQVDDGRPVRLSKRRTAYRASLTSALAVGHTGWSRCAK